ncbi:MAG TPA: [protein-PII] uridylyltransferase [Nitrospiraceae bacterium]|nr:[protein-PII] uridylyltransferase [Nitrospiraceae bacterium]
MTSVPDSGPNVGLLRDAETESASVTLAGQREAIRRRLEAGASGAEIVADLAELADGLIVGRYRNALRKAEENVLEAASQHCCLMALGGYGRRELAPHSDIDVMFLYRPTAAEAASILSRQVLHHLWDLGFQVGHSVRTIQDCLELAPTDLTIRTSMMEARFLAGSPQLFQEFHRRYFRQVVGRGTDRFLEQKMEERRREYEKFGETVYLLEPNIKKSKGGLRDLHVLQWAGMARYQAATIQDLADRGILSRQDFMALVEAREFLWRTRAFLHYGAGMSQEILSFDEQVRLAERFGFHDRPHLLAVEQFMQQYYRHTMGLHEASVRFMDRCRTVPVWRRIARLLPSPKVEGCFIVTGSSLTVPAALRNKVLGSSELLLRLFELAGSRHLKIDTDLLDEIHRYVDSMPEEAFRTPEVSRIFRNILAGPGAVAKTLEAMHRAHLLEKIIPVFATVRGLMQFNQYHKYTVDEHSLLAVDRAEALAREPGILGEVCQEIRRKDLLHLAVLLHDLGKGREEDHSEVGKAIAEETAARLRFDEQETRSLVFLVHQHLLMAHTAFRRDPYDEKVLLSFARAVGTPEVLRKLLILTAADIAAVGPGVLTKWKESLLIELYLRTLPEVSGERDGTAGSERLAQLARQVAQESSGRLTDLPWIESQLSRFPLRYVYGTAAKRIAAHLAAVRQLSAGGVLVEGSFNETLGTCEYTVVTHNDLTPGLFSKIAGVMAAKGLQILDAQIITREDGVVVDTFQVVDPDYAGPPPEARRAETAGTVVDVLKGMASVEDLVVRGSRLSAMRRLPTSRQLTEVQVDNETSDRFTILDVFADDRQGLLYVITHAIFTLGLSVHAARISTRLDQVVDVFYVSDRTGGKIVDPPRLETIRSMIKNEVDRFLEEQLGVPEGVSSQTSS